jgi:hypothetical protein
MLSEKLIHFYQSLRPPRNLPKDIGILFPQKDPQVIELIKKFFEKYFNDTKPRHLMLGINPGQVRRRDYRCKLYGTASIKRKLSN